MRFVDDARVVGRVLRALGVEFLVGLLELLHDLGHQWLVDKQVVLRGADLARVHDLAPEHTTRDQSRVGVLGHNGRVDATQLEHNGGQVRRGRLGDDTADVGATGEEDLIPSLGQQGLGLRDSTLDDCVARGVERGLDHLLHDDGAAGRILAGLDHDSVTGSDGTDDRAKGELEGEVEGTVQKKEHSC